jgi:hypothetical protein
MILLEDTLPLQATLSEVAFLFLRKGAGYKR